MVERLAIVFLVVLVAMGCKEVKDESSEFVHSIEIEATEDSLFVIEITNPHDTAITLELDLGPYMLKDIHDVASHIAAHSKDSSDLGKIKAAWEFVSKYTQQDKNHFGDKQWAQDDELILWSFGGGFCSKRATLLARLWQEMGYESRVWGLEGHVVPEVKLKEKWMMLDPTTEFYFINDDVIFSVEEISKLAEDEFENQFFKSIKNIDFGYAQAALLWQGKFYSTINDNSVSDWYLDVNADISEWIKLEGSGKVQLYFQFRDNNHYLVQVHSDHTSSLTELPYCIKESKCETVIGESQVRLQQRDDEYCHVEYFVNDNLPVSSNMSIVGDVKVSKGSKINTNYPYNGSGSDLCYSASEFEVKYKQFESYGTINPVDLYVETLSSDKQEMLRLFFNTFQQTFAKQLDQVLKNRKQLFLAMIKAECGSGDDVIREMKNYFE